LADPNTRQGKRTPVTLKIKFKSETLEQFIERYAVDVSQGGIFIRTKEPLAVGTQMKFEFQLRDASPLIAGEGTVVWTRENDPSRPAIAPGMGVRFDRLADGSQTVLERILAEKAKQAPSRGNEGPTKPPMFTDTPTKVAPAPVQEALGLRSRPKSDSEQTPLPPPRPFHSDADDFDEKAFEEATKVRSLDELAAQSAGLLGGSNDAGDDAPTNTAIPTPPDEVAARRGGRADSTVEPPAATPVSAMERESAPGLPEPPAATRSRPPLDGPAVARTKSGEPVARTKLGIEPAKAATRESVPRAVSQESSMPVAPERKSSAPLLILLLVLVAGGAAAVWWFVLRENVAQEVATTNPDPGSGSAAVATPEGSGSAGSAGSAVAIQEGSGSAAIETPAAPLVDTVIASNVAKTSTIEIVGTDQKGPAPLTAKLEKDKTYKALVTAPGYAPQEIEIKGGQDKQTAKLVLKPRVIMVTTEPAGADIYIDSVNTQKITPSEVQLTAAQAAKPKVRVSLRRPGYRPVDQSIAATAFKDGDSKMTTSVTVKLTAAQRPVNTGTTGTGTGSGSATTPTGTGSGSATTPTGTGSGSATTPTGTGTGSATTPTGTGTGTGSATKPPTPTGTGTGSATKPATGTGTGSATTPPAGGGGAGSAAKPPTGSGAAPTGGSLGGTATPSATNGEPEPTWTK
jgi:uncharacterized protein (TIGR02266 family)